jgi:hypothetical protein
MGSTQSISNAIKNKQWVQQVLSLSVPFLNTERTIGREHACPLPILLCLFFLYLPILSCQLPICHLFSSDGKMLFFHFILCQNLHLLDREHITSLLKNYFSIPKLLPDFQGKSSQIAIFGSDLLWVVTNPLIS